MSGEQRVIDIIGGRENLPTGTAERIGELTNRLAKAVEVMEESKDSDPLRWSEADEFRKWATGEISAHKALHEQEMRDAETKAALEAITALQADMATIRTPSQAGRIGAASPLPYNVGNPEKGAVLAAIRDYKGLESWGGLTSSERQAEGKAKLGELGMFFASVPSEAKALSASSKATLGLTDATGGFILPNAIVDELIKPARYAASVTRIVRTIAGVQTSTVDQPYRTDAPARATVVAWGTTKENLNLTYGGYTATLYTIARIYDVAKQFARFSAGAAEQDVMGELADGFARGESYYILRGSGSSEPFGIQTAITNAPATFTSSFTPSTTTLAGSILSAIATAGGALAGRDRTTGLSALVSGTSYWTLASQGTDNAGFFLDTDTDPQSPVIRAWGVPVYAENQLAGTDDLLVGQFDALKVYHGEGYRVDSSDVAGSRWDDNLIGFRGEMEMGLDARPAVYAGAFQFIADIIG